MNHAGLVRAARRWLASHGCPVVVTELATAGEEADALGWLPGGISVVVECKATRSDFLADRNKPWRGRSTGGLGRLRYYMAPAGMVSPDELAHGWGLLETDGRRIDWTVGSGSHTPDPLAETRVLLSLLRRMGPGRLAGASIKAYSVKAGKLRRATLVVEEEVAGMAAGVTLKHETQTNDRNVGGPRGRGGG